MIGCLKEFGEGGCQHQCAHTARVGGGEDDAHRPTLGVPEEGGVLTTDRIHDGSYVLHAFFDTCLTHIAVREARTTLVEQDHPSERGKTVEEPSCPWVLPHQVKVVHQARDEHKGKR